MNSSTTRPWPAAGAAASSVAPSSKAMRAKVFMVSSSGSDRHHGRDYPTAQGAAYAGRNQRRCSMTTPERPVGVHLSEEEMRSVTGAEKAVFPSPIPTQVISNGEYN